MSQNSWMETGMKKQETVNDWLKRTHEERYEKAKNYRIIDPAGYTLLSECSSVLPPQWFVNDVLHGRIVVEVDETETQFIVTTRKLGRE